MDNTDPYKTKFKEERLYMSTNQNLMQHMRELIDRIKAADVAYYRDDNPTMTDREYDLLVDELKELETTTGLILSGSPTQTVSGEILKELTPVRHTKPMLSADKTKSVDEMLQFANGRPVVLSWKLDGLTIISVGSHRGISKMQINLHRSRDSTVKIIKNRTVRLFRCSNVVRAAGSKILAALFISIVNQNTHLFQTRRVLLPPIKWRKNGTEKPMTRK